ncbi:MAG: T9SS type A sorting domain-containing protein [Ignavibacteriales bacterium]|nr:T9SS type A sorting domain-containing protein [Ignavibacteriales bacterium]
MKAHIQRAVFLMIVVMPWSRLCAQWTQTNGPFGAPVRALVVSGTNLFAGTDGSGVYSSSDNGAHWRAANAGLTVDDIRSFAVGPMTGDTTRSNLFAGTYSGGIFLSTNNGDTWKDVHSNLSSNSVTALAISADGGGGVSLYAGTDGDGVYRSTNNGTNWVAVNTGIPLPLAINALIVTQNPSGGVNIFAGTNGADGGVYLSTNRGASWATSNQGIAGDYVNSLVANGTNLFAGTNEDGVYRSSDNGKTWVAAQAGLPANTTVNAFCVNGTVLFAATFGDGVYRSSDNGASWTAAIAGLTDSYASALVSSGTNVFAGTISGVFHSTNNGTNWTAVNTGLSYRTVNTLVTGGDGTRLFAGTVDGGVYRSTDNGATWDAPNTGLKKYDGNTANVYALAVMGSTVFAGTDADNGVYRSSDNGATWIGAQSGLPNRNTASLFVSGTSLSAGAYGGGVYRSTDNGVTWKESDTGIPSIATVNALVLNGQYLFAGTFGSGVYRSTNNGTTWVAVNAGLPTPAWIKSLIVSQSTAGGVNLFAATEGDGLYRSTNNGTSWTDISTGLPMHTTGNALAVVGNALYLGTEGDGVFVSADSGASWVSVNTGLTDLNVNAFAMNVSGSGTANLFAGTGSSGVFRFVSNVASIASIAPSGPSQASLGTPFWVDVRVGDSKPVAGLYGVAFKLRSNQATCTYVDGSAVAGNLLGVNPLTFFHVLDPQGIDVGVSMSAGSGVSGNGIVARAQFVSLSPGPVRFSIENVTAVNQAGVAIPFDTTSTTVRVTSSKASLKPIAVLPVEAGKAFRVQIQVGDPNTISALYGISCKLRSNQPTCTYVNRSAAAGDFLGEDCLTVFHAADSQTVDLGVTKMARPGVDGSGVVASAQFISSVSGTVQFSLLDVIAVDTSGKAIDLETSGATITIASTIAVLRPLAVPPYTSGKPFWIEVRVGDPVATGLYGLSFKLRSDRSTCTYVKGSVASEAFFGANPLVLAAAVDSQTVDIGITKTAHPGIDGSGFVVKAQFVCPPSGDVHFSFLDVSAVDQNGSKISLNLAGGAITVTSSTRTPVLTGKVPARLPSLTPNTAVTFSVNVTDPNNLPLLYIWKVDGDVKKVGDSTFTWTFTQTSGSAYGIAQQSASSPTVTCVFQDQGGLQDSTVWSLATDVIVEHPVPTQFMLSQNYPNPFNPTTNFEFRIGNFSAKGGSASGGEFVMLKIFDVLGREVSTLVNEVRPAGVYTVRWDGSMMPSGVYLYRLRAGSFVSTKQMVLLK